MQKSCKNCNNNFKITDEDLEFYKSVSPTYNGEKQLISPPTHCPDCRQQRRLSTMNERFFYTSNCGLCKQKTITEQPPENNKITYCRECWHSDKWDPTTYGRDVDFSRPMFEQFQELRNQVPSQNLLIEGTNVNSQYIHYAGFAKNCYLIMHADYCEDCYYGYGFKKNTSCVDGFYNMGCELCYDCVDIHKCYGLKGSQDCINCNSSSFLRDCVGCQNCFLCVGLRNKEYCFENKQLTKEQYEEKMKEIDLGSYKQYQKYKSQRKEIEKNHKFKEFHGHNLENSSGDYLQNCKDTTESFDCEDVEGGKHLYQVVTGAKNVHDINQYGLNLTASYECSTAGNDCYQVLFCHNVHVNCSNLLYCWYLENSKDCFGCFNMHHKKYCILNKQYTKEEYEELVPKIIEHMRKTEEWGEAFPITMSTFGYNKSSAQMYFPLTKEDVRAKGWKWDETEQPPPDVKKVVTSEVVPDNINDIPDLILDWAIKCEVTGKPFRITEQELKFYREQHLPIPHKSPDQRHLDRFAQRNPRTFWDRQCAKCNKDIRTTYSPDKPETVYCEACYKETTY